MGSGHDPDAENLYKICGLFFRPKIVQAYVKVHKICYRDRKRYIQIAGPTDL